MIEAILIAIAGPIAKLVENAIGDSYDKDVELQALLDMGRAISDARAKALLDQVP
jgi:hypothetical protein